jgi:sterol desaturase/sphingolipid hydroxylase (fatty acid hydroxylase superfamily)
MKSVPASDYRSAAAAWLTLIVGAVAVFLSGPVEHNARPPWLLNPTGILDWPILIAGPFVTYSGKELFQIILEKFEHHIIRVQRFEISAAKGKLEMLQHVDICFIGLNSLPEFILFNHIAAFCAGPLVEGHLAELTIMNGPVAYILSLLAFDFVYWLFHATLHHGSIYQYIHKHHHRQQVPFRGYADAVNVHPFEELCGATCFWLGLVFAASTIGMHAGAAWMAMGTWIVFNIGNHAEFDSPIHAPLPFPSGPRDHQMHHRVPNCNYAILTMLFDHLFGTYKPYTPVGMKDCANPNEAKDSPTCKWKPDKPTNGLVPSPWCVLPFGPSLVVFALAHETCRLSAAAGELTFPTAADAAKIWAPLGAGLLYALACALPNVQWHSKTD